ncbi:MAG: hypoxanthine phosphoribosyltransferase [Flavobacteriales bacterium]|nr:hypoxanthine phosphoribosyltransferase [Flavobacteriales bacterium]
MPEPATAARVRLHDKEFVPYIPAADLHAAIDRVAAALQERYAGKRPLFLGVLNGAFFFAAELMKRLEMECEITFIKVASYHGTSSTGTVTQLIGLSERLDGRHVVVVEDIVDTGGTIAHIMDALSGLHPASVSVAALLFKPEAYTRPWPIEHVALRIPNAFVVGSGLDHDGLGRNLPGIWRITEPTP